MEKRKIKNFNYYMRALHRDIGFLTLGLVMIYALSGIILVYRDTGFLKHEVKIEKKLSSNMKESELSRALHMKNFKVTKTEGNTLYFKSGTYNTATGVVVYKAKEVFFPLNQFIKLHKASTKSPIHFVTVIFGLLMLFMGVSSFWMFKNNTRLFLRGIYLTGSGTLLAILLLFL